MVEIWMVDNTTRLRKIVQIYEYCVLKRRKHSLDEEQIDLDDLDF